MLTLVQLTITLFDSYTIKSVIVLLVNLQQRYYCEFYNFYYLNSLICSDRVSETVHA